MRKKIFIFTTLKKATAILFLCIYLFSTTEAYQLLKLPVVFQHYQEHKKESRSITFLEFLDMHYMHGSPRDADYARDMQLPFKSSGDFVSNFTITAFVPVVLEFTILKPTVLLEKNTFAPQENFILTGYSCNIWQPPKFS